MHRHGASQPSLSKAHVLPGYHIVGVTVSVLAMGAVGRWFEPKDYKIGI